jgi:signal transduction histidine kinase/ActR/RegA family two-component response regulator
VTARASSDPSVQSTRSNWSLLFLPALLTLLAALAIAGGGFALHHQLSTNERTRAAGEARELASGLARTGSEEFWRFREAFTFSLTQLPYEALLARDEVSPDILIPLRRFLALNTHIVRELVVISPGLQGRVLRLKGENYFVLTPLGEQAPPAASTDTAIISGLVQSGDGSITARVYAVIDPVLFWRQMLTSYGQSHPNLWLHFFTPYGRQAIIRSGAGHTETPSVFAPENSRTLMEDLGGGYEGRLLHTITHDGRKHDLISAYVPVTIEHWRGLLLVSVDESVVLGPAGKALSLLAAIAGVLIVLLLTIFGFLVRNILRHQRQLEDGNLRIQVILDTVQSGILLARTDTGLIQSANPAALVLIGAPEIDVVGVPLQRYFPSAPGAAATRLIDHAGREHPILAATQNVTLADGRYLLCSFVDITPLKETERNLLASEANLRETNARLGDTILRAQQLAREASAANKAKSTFLAMMSHELRTPLNSILGLSESLTEGIHGPLNEKQNRYLTLVVSSGRHLLNLINDILDLAKIESGRDEIQFAPCSLREICETSLQMVAPLARRRRQTLEHTLPDRGIQLRADSRRLTQVLVNLLGNAVKFTPEEGVLGLRVTVQSSEVVFEIWDRGIGIAAEDLPRLFNPFVQLDDRLSRAYEGTGLGLALVKQIVSIHGGRTEVASEKGRGTTFTVILPCSPETSAPAPVVPSPAADFTDVQSAPHLILIAEDNPLNIVALRDYLEIKGCTVEVAENGLVALEKTRALRPALILMDVQMPVLDGIEAMRRIRDLPDAALSATPIIAVTALAMPQDREACFDAGANDYLSKPYSLPELHRRILSLLPNPVEP